MSRQLACCLLLSAACLNGAEREPQVQTLQPGMRLTLIAEHPDLVTPTGIDVDRDGHVWLVASHTHFPPDNYPGPKHDEILIFDPDGRRHVFYNATHHTMDLELGSDGWVYLAERDRILRIKDSDGDGQADLEETLATLASDAVYPHNGLSGLTWHSNGDLLFGVGENFAKPWTLTGTDKTVYRGTGAGGIFRCRTDGTELRRIARGLWNPFGLCVRQDGVIFAVDNDPGERPPCRLLHIVDGGDYGYQRAYGQEAHHPFVGWYGQLRGTLPMLHPAGEAPCGVCPLGRGLIVPSWSDHRVYFYALQPHGASFTANRIELVQGGRYFRPTGIAFDPSHPHSTTLSWYLNDWVDGRYQVHGYGRLWKLDVDLPQSTWVGPKELALPTPEAQLAADLRHGLQEQSQQQLLRLAGQSDPFVAQAALAALARTAIDWQPVNVENLAAQDRVQAVLALKLAATAKPQP
ncbi:MAG: PVC-type heme-binding CxxCH protein, partial [Pirellulales bacterium]